MIRALPLLAAALAAMAGSAAAQGGFGGFSGTGVEERAMPPAMETPGAARPAPGQAEERRMGLDRARRRDIQAGLNAAGYPVGTPDGAFGQRTRNAIAAFQRQEGLPATGYWSPQADARLAERSGGGGQAPAQQTAGLPNGSYTAPKTRDGAWWGTAELTNGELSLALKAESTLGRVTTLRCREKLGSDGAFRCFLSKAGWAKRTVYGTFPKLRIDAMGQVGGGDLNFTRTR